MSRAIQRAVARRKRNSIYQCDNTRSHFFKERCHRSVLVIFQISYWSRSTLIITNCCINDLLGISHRECAGKRAGDIYYAALSTYIDATREWFWSLVGKCATVSGLVIYKVRSGCPECPTRCTSEMHLPWRCARAGGAERFPLGKSSLYSQATRPSRH